MLDVNLVIEPDVDPKAEAIRLIERAQRILAGSLIAGHARRVRVAVSFLKLKYPVSYQQLLSVAELLWAIFLRSSSNIFDETDVASALASVLKLLNKLVDCPPPSSADRLVLPWKPLYESLIRFQLHGCSPEDYAIAPTKQVPFGPEARKAHSQAVFNLIRRARNFFAGNAAIEIVDTLRPYFCPSENTVYRAVGILCLLLPENVGADALQEICCMWNAIPNCLEWTYLWIQLFSRLARHAHSTFVSAFQSQIPRLFDELLAKLEVPTSKDSFQKPDLLTWPADCSFLIVKTSLKNEIVKKMTRLIVFSISPQSCTSSLLQNIFLYLKPFYHPLNEGAWTSALEMFLKMLTLNFAKRIGFETKTHRPKRPWQPVACISEDDRRRFVELVLPIALTAFESKDYLMSFAAVQTLKDLVGLDAQITLPSIIEQLIPALENNDKPHQTLNAMEAFSEIIGPLLRSEGGLDSEVIAPMLQQTVAGVDNNDPMKTLKTLRMYMRLANLVPLVHPSDMPGSKPEWIYVVPDWSMEVLGRLWNFISNIPPIKKGSGLEHIFKPTMMCHFLDTFFQQMSPSIHAAALKNICQKVSSTFYPPGKKYFGQILNALVFADSATSVPVVIPLLVGKILQVNKVDLVGVSSETSYWVHLLGHAVQRGGEHVNSFTVAIDAVLNAVVMHEDKGLRKEGRKLLRKVLRSNLNIRPLDFRSLCPSTWNFAQSAGFRDLVHPVVDPTSVDVKFYRPSPACKQRAQELVDRYLTLVTAKLTNSAGAPSVSDLRACLGCLEAIVRGGAAGFAEAELSLDDQAGAFGDVAETECDESEGNVGLACSVSASVTEWGVNTRQAICRLLLQVCAKHAVRENADVASIKALIRVLNVFLSSNGYKAPEHDPVNYNKAVFRLWNEGMAGTFTRNMLVQKAQATVNRRLAGGAWRVCAETDQLLSYLLEMCMHEYSAVRKKAQTCIPKVLFRYPRFADRAVAACLLVFRDPTSTKARVNGAIYTVNTAAMLKRIAKQWRHISALVIGLLTSHHFTDLKVHVRLAELWNSFVPYTGRLGFPSDISNADEIAGLLTRLRLFSSPTETTEAFAESTKRLQGFRTRQEQIFDGLFQTIEASLENSAKLHWRFSLLAASAASLFLRRQRPPSSTVFKFLLQGLTSEVLPLRQLSRAVFPTAVYCAGGVSGAMDVCEERDVMQTDRRVLSFSDLDLPLTAPEYDGPFVDCAWQGWIGLVDSESPSGVPFTFSCPLVMEELVAWVASARIKRFCELVAADHRLSGDERAANADAAPIAGMPLPSSAIQSLFDSSWFWPRTAAASFSSAFNRRNALTIEALVAGGGGVEAARALLTELEQAMAKSTDREQQCLGAELLAGIVRAVVSMSSEERRSVEARLESLTKSGLAQVPMEAAGDWVEALRMSVCNRDPRRFRWLARAVAALTEAGVEGPTAAMVCGLKLQQALLLEFGWRGYSLAAEIVLRLFSFIGGASKSVREEAARCLHMVALVDCCLPSSSSSWRPHVAGDGVGRIQLAGQLRDICRIALESYSAGTGVRSEGNAESKATQQKVEGILYFFIHAARSSRPHAVVPYAPDALPLVLAVLEDADREFSQIGKVAWQMIASSCDHSAHRALVEIGAAVLPRASSWRVRMGTLDMVRVLAHRFVLDATMRQRAFEIFRGALTDGAVDVRVLSQLCLAGLLRMAEEAVVHGLIEAAPKPRRRGTRKSTVDEGETQAVRHGRVLAVSAAVLSHPTDLPDWMADAVTALCSLSDEDAVVKQTIVHTVGEFKKTHQDQWPTISLTWSSDQLSLMSDFTGARTYYS